jgi:hypothetical protein
MTKAKTKFVLALGAAVVILYVGGIYGAQHGWFWSVDFDFDDDDIAGQVASADGPEAGVWVIAQSQDLKNRFARIVVTDDKGRYVLTDLPPGGYDVWVRGYGLVDSKAVPSEPGRMLNLTAGRAHDAAAADPPRPQEVERNLVLTLTNAQLQPAPPSEDRPTDRVDALGLGQGATIEVNKDALLATWDGHMVALRVPYPMGGTLAAPEGRIEDPDTGWKGRGVWAAYTGAKDRDTDETAKLAHFQLRPDPLAH